MTIDFPYYLPSMANERLHWAAKQRMTKQQREIVYKMWLTVPKKQWKFPPCTVTLTRFGPRMLDGDNLQAAFKAMRDATAKLLGVDDADPKVTWLYRQEKSKEYRVRIEIT